MTEKTPEQLAAEREIMLDGMRETMLRFLTEKCTASEAKTIVLRVLTDIVINSALPNERVVEAVALRLEQLMTSYIAWVREPGNVKIARLAEPDAPPVTLQ